MKQKLDPGQEILYKSFELDPLAKMSVEIGKKNAKHVLSTLEYLGSLTIPHDLSFLGVDKRLTPLDPATALYLRDHSVYSNVRRTIDHGIAHQYGEKLLSGNNAAEPLVGAASAIALVERDESDNIKIFRKKQLGLENKHARDLVREFHGMKDEQEKEQKEEDIDKEEDLDDFEPPWLKQQDHETQMMMMKREERKPPLIQDEDKPPLKNNVTEVEEEDDRYIPPW